MLKTCDPLQLPHGSVLSVPGLGVLRGEDSRGLAAALHLQVGRLYETRRVFLHVTCSLDEALFKIKINIIAK